MELLERTGNAMRFWMVLHFPYFRRRELRRLMEDFNPGLRPGKVDRPRFMPVWENDNRLRWLDYPADAVGCEVRHMPRTLTIPAFQRYVSAYTQELGMGDANIDLYYEPEVVVMRKKFRSLMKGMIRDLLALYHFDVFILPKMNDDWMIDFVLACQELGVPMVVNDRESIITPQRQKVYPPVLKRIMPDLEAADLLSLNNQPHRDFWLASGFPEERMRLTGKPETDYWFRKDLWKDAAQIHPRLASAKNIVLFYSFGLRTYMNWYYGDEKRNWYDLAADYHDALAELLIERGEELVLIYKTGGKPSRDYFPGFDDFMAKIQAAGVVDNLVELKGNVSSLDLVRFSHIVVGFQTSGLIEAMFSDTPVVYGAWGEFYEEIKDTLFPFHTTGSVRYARSPDELKGYLIQLIDDPAARGLGESELQERKRFRELYYFPLDGNSSRRVLEAAMELLPGS